MKKIFKIGHFCFQVVYPTELMIPHHFLQFEVKNENINYVYDISICHILPIIDGKIIAQRDDIIVYQTSNGEARMIGMKGRSDYYACYEEVDSKHAKIIVDSHSLDLFSIDPVFVSIFALERHLLKSNEFILHCSYIEYQNKALLFSGPSGIGKSTQADLWQLYLESKIINGDRALIGFNEDGYLAQGWPVCGTSNICHNLSLPIQAIIMLEQGEENHITQLSKGQAFSLLYSQITMNKWNYLDHLKTMDLIEHLICTIPIYQYTCTISKEAVLYLKHTIYKD